MMTTALALLAATLAAQPDEAPTMVRTEDIHMRDPWIMPHEDRYVLIGTTGDAWGVEGGGFAVFTSTDLREWTPHGQALELDDPPIVYTQTHPPSAIAARPERITTRTVTGL